MTGDWCSGSTVIHRWNWEPPTLVFKEGESGYLLFRIEKELPADGWSYLGYLHPDKIDAR